MHEHVAVAAAPESAPRTERQPARQSGATERLIAVRLARRPTPVLALRRCDAGGSTCGGACGGRGHDEELDDELRMGAAALQRAVANRRMVARDQDPGPPEAPEMKGGSCGFKSDGTWSCTGETGKGALELDPKSLPSTAPPTPPGRPPASCPTDRWNWFSNKCCPEGQFFDQAQRKCATLGKEQPIKPFELPSSPPLPPSSPAPFVVPPEPEPPQKGDFPLPDASRAYA